jgi:hypothetical protein
MNCKKILSAALVAAGALFCASSAHAQANVYMVGVGSSALYASMTLAEVTPDPITGAAAPCGTNVWTGKNGTLGVTASGTDARGGGLPNETGTISVVWNNAAATAGNPIPANSGAVICVFLSVDSVVGQRLFFGRNAAGNDGTLNFNDAGAVGDQQVAGINDSTTTVPPGVTAAVNGLNFTHAYTDIRPEDGQFAFFRIAGTQTAPSGPFGYDPLVSGSFPLVGTPVHSSFSASFAQPSPFNITGTDPSSGGAIPQTTTIPIGAAPVLVIVNSNVSLANATNILSKTAAKLFSGQIGDPQAVFGTTVVPGAGQILSQIQREPISGTYNTFEFQVVHARDGSSSDTQETSTVSGTGLINPTPQSGPGTTCPAGGPGPTQTPAIAFAVGQLGCTNAMFINSQNNSIRYRAIGTGEMVNAVINKTAFPTLVVGGAKGDNIGYAFYGFGAMWGKANLKYLQLQGLDALYSNYATAGAFPACAGAILPAPSTLTCPVALPTFVNMLNGSYRVWSIQRAILTTAATAANTLVKNVIIAAQDQSAFALKNPVAAGNPITNIADWAPIANTNTTGNAYTPFTFAYFRSHYPIDTTANANNGTVATYCSPDQPALSPCGAEEGGDMAGVAFQIETDVLYNHYLGTNNFLFTQVE